MRKEIRILRNTVGKSNDNQVSVSQLLIQLVRHSLDQSVNI